MADRDTGIVLLRGVGGGIIAGLLLLVIFALSYQLWLGGIPYPTLLIFPGLPLALFVGAVSGFLVGITILFFHLIGKSPNTVVRLIVGIVVIQLASLFISIISNDSSNVGVTGPFPPELIVIFSTINKLVLGGLPGLMARPKDYDAV